MWKRLNKKQKAILVLTSPIWVSGIVLGFFKPMVEAGIQAGEQLFEDAIEKYIDR